MTQHVLYIILPIVVVSFGLFMVYPAFLLHKSACVSHISAVERVTNVESRDKHKERSTYRECRWLLTFIGSP